MHKGFLLAFPVRETHVRVHEGRPILCSRRHACYELVIYTLMCAISYMLWPLSLLLVYYIELELSLSGGLKSITVVKA